MSSNLPSPTSFKPILNRFVSSASDFTADDVRAAIEHLATPNGATDAQIGAFLTALKLSGREFAPDIINACADVMRLHAVDVIVDGAGQEPIVDIVGTGGDGHDTFNVSTSAAIVAAGAGARVCKHGNRASTSSSGSADILASLGCTPLPATTKIPRIPFYFLLASHFHPALVALSPIRKSLPFRTLFNSLGPLLNPARPSHMVLGVADRALGQPFAEALRSSGVTRAYVVCGMEGLDEVSIAGSTWVWSLEETGEIVQLEIHPSQFGLPTHPLSKVVGSTPTENAALLTALLTPGATRPQPSNGATVEAIEDFILLNAAALLFVAGIASSYEEGVGLARESIGSGKALAALETFRAYSQ
ncbi:hypothetical protein BOTBODRAFT_31241 [Botryobasidium botryosum FD-172 SS1]|uniref:Anthranilate phosphoribosyltransferase n=1 Tax=Botryobasidium botryosum (strain FD-172 SS1) TaxID=930990 RepID=A0A067MW97_BOTB1|nr:hypothetical protein BOTBODRAFT_31241 [Botryobasidium botryosum FD-172 SS1]